MEAAADRGCNLITHLYSCTSTIRREKGFRIAGVIEAAYLRDDISAEIIADGCHLPNELLRLVYKCKGADRLALVTDSMCAGGTDAEGEFELSGVPCIVEDGVAKLLDRSAFAGSVATTDRLVRTVVRAGIPLCDAIKMMTETPAKIMGLSNVGKLSVGYDADIVIFDEDINVNTVISKGNIVKG
jgi:N-acetylglucosamine-6-phosphate deacetylase